MTSRWQFLKSDLRTVPSSTLVSASHVRRCHTETRLTSSLRLSCRSLPRSTRYPGRPHSSWPTHRPPRLSDTTTTRHTQTRSPENGRDCVGGDPPPGVGLGTPVRGRPSDYLRDREGPGLSWDDEGSPKSGDTIPGVVTERTRAMTDRRTYHKRPPSVSRRRGSLVPESPTVCPYSKTKTTTTCPPTRRATSTVEKAVTSGLFHFLEKTHRRRVRDVDPYETLTV